jgi:hypothetical protein
MSTSHPQDKALRELAAFWRGVAADEREGIKLMHPYTQMVRKPEERAAVWERCAQQLELVLQGKSPYPDV